MHLNVSIIGCEWISKDTTCSFFMKSTTTLKNFTMINNTINHPGTANAALLNLAGNDLLLGDIRWNALSHRMTANSLFFSQVGTASSGILAHNRVGHADVTGSVDLGISGRGFRLFDNLITSVDNLSGFVLPPIDVDS